MVTKTFKHWTLNSTKSCLIASFSRGKKFWSDVWYFLSISIPDKCSWKLFRYLSVLNIVMIKNVKLWKFRPLNQSFTNISPLSKNTPQICHILHQFNFTYCLFVGKNWWRLNISFFTFLGDQNVRQNGNVCLYFENSRKGPTFKASDEC